jgi:hypothetical protein
MENGRTTTITVRDRSTPWDYRVVLATTKHSEFELFGGQGYMHARAAYWQAISLLQFYGLSGSLSMELTEKRQPYGGFRTEVNAGNVYQCCHHIPHGACLDWAYRRGTHWKRTPEFIIALIPGMICPRRHPR